MVDKSGQETEVAWKSGGVVSLGEGGQLETKEQQRMTSR